MASTIKKNATLRTALSQAPAVAVVTLSLRCDVRVSAAAALADSRSSDSHIVMMQISFCHYGNRAGQIFSCMSGQ
jgi:hypothetical protein